MSILVSHQSQLIWVPSSIEINPKSSHQFLHFHFAYLMQLVVDVDEALQLLLGRVMTELGEVEAAWASLRKKVVEL